MPSTFHPGTHRVRSVPSSSSYFSVKPPKSTRTAASGCGNSHGPPSASHVSGCSTCRPVDERLAEDPVLVADAVADARHAHGGQRIDEARRETAQAAVAQTGLNLLGAQGRQVQPTTGQRLLGHVIQVGRHQRIAELPAQQVLRGQVADELRPRRPVVPHGLQPPRHQVVPDRAGQGQVLVVDGRPGQGHALTCVQLPQELPDEAVHRVRRGSDRGDGQGMSRREGRANPTGTSGRTLVGRDRGRQYQSIPRAVSVHRASVATHGDSRANTRHQSAGGSVSFACRRPASRLPRGRSTPHVLGADWVAGERVGLGNRKVTPTPRPSLASP